MRTRATLLNSPPEEKPATSPPPLPPPLSSYLKRADGGTLKPQVSFEILGDLPHQPLERQLPDQKLGRFLITTDFSKRNGPRPGEQDDVNGHQLTDSAAPYQEPSNSRTAERRLIVFPQPCLPVAMRLLHPAGRGGAFPGSFSGQLFTGRFPPRGFTSSLLGSGHFLSPKIGICESQAAPQGKEGEKDDGAGSATLPWCIFTTHPAAADGRRRLLPLP